MRSSVWFPPLVALAAFFVAPAAWSGTPRTVTPRIATPLPDPATLCDTAITSAEYAGRLPPRLLGAIGLTESGRVDPASGKVHPWPWTINAEGAGQFFETKQQAIDAVKALQARGVQSIDVGCMQVNLMYHPNAFTSLDAAFDPNTNATYATRFLNALYTSSHDWARAIAAYHSETPALGDPYRLLVMAHWQNADLHPVHAPTSVYADFGSRNLAYGAFAPPSQVYAAFAVTANGH